MSREFFTEMYPTADQEEALRRICDLALSAALAYEDLPLDLQEKVDDIGHWFAEHRKD